MLRLKGPVKVEFNSFGMIIFPKRLNEDLYTLSVDYNGQKNTYESRDSRTINSKLIKKYIFENEVEIAFRNSNHGDTIVVELIDSCVLNSDMKSNIRFKNMSLSCINNCIVDYFKTMAENIHILLDNSIAIIDVKNHVQLHGNVINSSSIIIHHPHSIDVRCNIDNDQTSTVTINTLEYKK